MGFTKTDLHRLIGMLSVNHQISNHEERVVIDRLIKIKEIDRKLDEMAGVDTSNKNTD